MLAGKEERRNRITSYNVCYTKLLRIGTVAAHRVVAVGHGENAGHQRDLFAAQSDTPARSINGTVTVSCSAKPWSGSMTSTGGGVTSGATVMSTSRSVNPDMLMRSWWVPGASVNA